MNCQKLWAKKRVKIAGMIITFMLILLAGGAYISWAWKKDELCKCDIVIVGIISLFTAFVLIMNILREFRAIKE